MPSSNQADSGLYAIADHESCLAKGLRPESVVEAMYGAGVAWVQLRAKRLDDETYLRWIESSAESCPPEVRLVINDRVDLALLADVKAVHLGQDDMPIERASKIAPDTTFGLSTHDLVQLRAGLSTLAGYLAFGPVFATSSKLNPEPTTGIAGLAEAHRLCRDQKRDLVAIGGVSEASLDQVAAHAEFVAAISLLLPQPETTSKYGWIEQRCRSMHERIRQIKRLGSD